MNDATTQDSDPELSRDLPTETPELAAEPEPESTTRSSVEHDPRVGETSNLVRSARVLRASDIDRLGGRGVQWVRPSDLLAQQSARLAGRGIDFQVRLLGRARSVTTGTSRDLSDRGRRLPPLEAFGHGASEAHVPARSGAGLS